MCNNAGYSLYRYHQEDAKNEEHLDKNVLINLPNIQQVKALLEEISTRIIEAHFFQDKKAEPTHPSFDFTIPKFEHLDQLKFQLHLGIVREANDEANALLK